MQTTMQQPQQQQQQNQPMFMTPPQVVTSKDLLYLKDAMSWLLDAFKKCSHFSSQVQDPQLRQEIDRIGQMHQRHYNMLLQHCANNNMQQMMAVQQQQQQQNQMSQ
ncbi:hypothetical protein [Ammoniphilus sp. YIM 78166]|uniref:hypothetical protein n=1 Tax=Ammoniphilus sp. YIM 78166 TaxID=1644106 RepID=UPI001F0EC092|nr:hypothetical protein [Ammoniphilus sp. YIM 78166]